MSARFPLAALLVLGLSCAHPAPAIVTSGQSVVLAGKTFEATAAAFYSQCSQWDSPGAKPLISLQACTDFAAFADRFKAIYQAAADGYDVAASGGADGGAYDVTPLLSQLGAFSGLVKALGLTPGSP